jgi:hypothetical protein
MKRIVALLSIAVAFFPALLCTNNSAGIETTNGATVVATASSITGTVPAYSQVTLIDTSFVPLVYQGRAFATSAGITGVIDFLDLVPGVYTVIVETPDGRNAAAFQDISIGSSTSITTLQKNLEPTGTLSGIVATATPSSAGILLYLVGTDYYLALPGPGPFTFESIAPGDYDLNGVGLADGSLLTTPTILSNSAKKTVKVIPGAKTVTGTLSLP